jgi:hypothetical protein
LHVAVDYHRLAQNELEQRILRMSVAWVDLLSAGFAFESLIAHPSYREIRSSDRAALVEAAVIAYCRPFSHSGGLGAEWPAFAVERWRLEHERVLDYRHAFVGHSDADPRTVTIETDASPRGWSSRVNLPIYMPGRAETALEMCRDLHTRLNEHLNQAIAELIRRERNGGPPDAPVRVTLPR